MIQTERRDIYYLHVALSPRLSPFPFLSALLLVLLLTGCLAPFTGIDCPLEMALIQSAYLPGPSWDDEVVPALRKREFAEPLLLVTFLDNFS